MSRVIKVVIEIDEDDFKEFIEGEGGAYDEDCLWEDINGVLDCLPFCASTLGYTICGDDENE